MSALVEALDNFTPVQTGENGHTEFAWSNSIEEKIIQLDFQCVRTDENGIQSLSTVLDDILRELSVVQTNFMKEEKRKELLCILYKMIGKTRDIEGGKGEYAISYMMIWTWYKYYPALAEIALALFVFEPFDIPFETLETNLIESVTKQGVVPYGSWKDIKYFCDYVRTSSGGREDHPLIGMCVKYINTQLRLDENAIVNGGAVSLAGKWVPRQKSKFAWLHKALAYNFYSEYLNTATDDVGKQKATKKCETRYRIMYSSLNRHLDTVQIKQAGKSWATIDHAKTTSITMTKQRKAFMNLKIKGNGETRTEDPDRIICAENFKIYLESLKKEGKEVKGKNVGLEMFTKQAYGAMYNPAEADIVNSQWRDNCNNKNSDGLGPMIAMVDTSGSMNGDPMNAAIALGCRVAEKSILGKRVMTFSSEPTWINMEGCDTFTDMVKTIRNSDKYAGMSTNFYKALDTILCAIEERCVPPADVENMILAIFSDMQIDDNISDMTGTAGYDPNPSQKATARGKWATMFQKIKQKYTDVGMRMYGQPLNPPHILFWNLRNTSGFPTLSTEAGCSMMSGYDPSLLNMFCELGMDALKDYTPFKMLVKTLDNERYLPLEVVIQHSL
jgi:hypothetical protein